MDSSHKYHVWILLLLVWNGALLSLVLWMLWFQPPASLNVEELSQACGATTLETLKDACVNL